MRPNIPILSDKEIFRQIDQARNLPPLLFNTLEDFLKVARTELDSAEQIKTIVRYDQVLLAKVLYLANSPAFGQAARVGTISEAVDVVGSQHLKSFCLSNLLKHHFSATQRIARYQKEQLWKHSYVAAKAAACIAEKRNWISEELAYSLGIIHNIGSTLMAFCFPEAYAYMQQQSFERNIPLWYIESAYGLTHTKLGDFLAIRWSLPEVFQLVINFHHQPDKADTFKPEVKLIALACILANGKEHPQLLRDKETLSWCADLYITKQEWEKHIECIDEFRTYSDQIWRMLS